MRHFEFSRRCPGRPAWSQLVFWTGCWFITLVALSLLYRMRRFGFEHVPYRGPVIFASNHQSHLDPPIVGVLTYDRPFTAMARSTLFTNRWFSWLIRSIGAIPLRKGGSGDTAAFKATLGELEAGRCVLVFPEGTRTRDGSIGTFHKGLALLVARSGAPVVPVALEGAYEVWPTGRSAPKLSGCIMVQAGPAIPAEEFLRHGAEAGLAELKLRIERMRSALREKIDAQQKSPRKAMHGR